MTNSRYCFIRLLGFVLTIFTCFLAPSIAQVPQGIPTEDVETDWSTWSAKVWYIILPVAIIILYVAGRRRWKKPEDKQY